jgi:type I restriction enzyme, S subunit
MLWSPEGGATAVGAGMRCWAGAMAFVFRRDGPWELPEGWVWARLGDLGRWTGGGTPSKSNASFWIDGTFPWVSPKDMKSEIVGDSEDRITAVAIANSSTKLVPAHSVLMVVRSGILSRTFPVAVCDREVTLNQDMRALIPLEGINARYLSFVLRRLQRHILDECSKDGTTVASVEPARLENILVPIAPAFEQRRIVARIDELFTDIADGEAALTRAHDDLDTWLRALLKAAVTGALTREWREHNKSGETGADLINRLRRETALTTGRLIFDPEPSSDGLPDTWAWCKVEEGGEVGLGRQRAPQHHNGQYMRPYLRVANVLEDALDLTDVKWMNFTPEEFRTFALEPGDILLNEGQTPDLLGRPAIYQGEIEGCCFQKTLLRFRSKEGILPEFALIVFRHYMRSGRFRRESRITTNMAHLTQVRFVVMEFPVPPTQEQAEIVRRFRFLEGEAGEPFDHIGEFSTEALRQSILKAAFEGRLVEQDSRDESLDQLLTRPSQRTSATDQPHRTTRMRRVALAAE